MKGGLNDYAVSVVKPFHYDDPTFRCLWLGHNRFRCGHCKMGYFNVQNENKHDLECPECKYRVIVRWDG